MKISMAPDFRKAVIGSSMKDNDRNASIEENARYALGVINSRLNITSGIGMETSDFVT